MSRIATRGTVRGQDLVVVAVALGRIGVHGQDRIDAEAIVTAPIRQSAHFRKAC